MATKYGMFQENVYLRPEPPAAGDPAASTGARSRGGSAGATATADRDGINFKITVARTGKVGRAMLLQAIRGMACTCRV